MIRVEQVVLRVVSQKPFFAYSPFFCSISTQSVEAAEVSMMWYVNRRVESETARRKTNKRGGGVVSDCWVHPS